MHATKNRLTDPSKIRALDFKQEFRRFAICSVSATIGIDRSIFLKSPMTLALPAGFRKDRQHGLSESQPSSGCFAPKVCSSQQQGVGYLSVARLTGGSRPT
jgi:hypothetical protein